MKTTGLILCVMLFFIAGLQGVEPAQHAPTLSDYLSDWNNYGRILQAFNLRNLTKNDWDTAKKKVELKEQYQSCYVDKNENVDIYIEGRYAPVPDYNRIRSMTFRINSGEDLRFIGLDRQMTYNDLVNRFGKPRLRGPQQKYTLMCYPYEGASAKECVSLGFMCSPSDKPDANSINYVFVDPVSIEHLTRFEQLIPIKSGCLAGDCENGEGIYLYPDGTWVDGKFAYGNFQGDSSSYSFFYTDGFADTIAQKKASLRQAVIDQEKADAAVDVSFWHDYLDDPNMWSDLIQLFNCKEFNRVELQALVKNHGFSEKNGTFISKDGKVSLDFTVSPPYLLKWMDFYIKEPKDLLTFGLHKQAGIDDIRRIYGQEYKKTKGSLEVMHYSGNSLDRTQHIRVKFIFEDNESRIASIGFLPTDPWKIKIEEELQPLKIGAISGNCTNGEGIWRYADGWRFEGEFRNGRPFKGVFYSYYNPEKPDHHIYTGEGDDWIAYNKPKSGLPGILEKVDGECFLLQLDLTKTSNNLLKMQKEKNLDTRERLRLENNRLIKESQERSRNICSQLRTVRDKLQESGTDFDEDRSAIIKDIQLCNKHEEMFKLMHKMTNSFGSGTTEDARQLETLGSEIFKFFYPSVLKRLEERGL